MNRTPLLRKTRLRKVSKKQAVKERALAKTKREMWEEFDFHICPICDLWIREYADCDLDHIKPRKMGGSARDDSRENLQLTHSHCNRFVKGSKRLTKGSAG